MPLDSSIRSTYAAFPVQAASNPDNPVSSGHDLRADANSVFERLVDQLDALHERITALEAQQVEPAPGIVAFAQSRRSWTVKQLADDLQVHVNTVRNWTALPTDSARHLESFQPGGSGPHIILPQHIADWISRNSAAVVRLVAA